MSRAVRWVIDTAGSVTGTRFRLVMASSATATALIIGSTLASGGDSGLASQLRQALAALGGSSPSTPAAATPVSTPVHPDRVEGGRVPGAGLSNSGDGSKRARHLAGEDAEDQGPAGRARQARLRDRA